MWAELTFPPINLWNLPKQYKDVTEDELVNWLSLYEEFKDDD